MLIARDGEVLGYCWAHGPGWADHAVVVWEHVDTWLDGDWLCFWVLDGAGTCEGDGVNCETHFRGEAKSVREIEERCLIEKKAVRLVTDPDLLVDNC